MLQENQMLKGLVFIAATMLCFGLVRSIHVAGKALHQVAGWLLLRAALHKL